MNEDPPRPQPVESLVRWADVPAKASAALGLVLYSIGFLIVNAHLSKFGFADYSFANVRFASSGLVFGVVFLIWWLILGHYVATYSEVERGQLAELENADLGLKWQATHTFGAIFFGATTRLILAALVIQITLFEDGWTLLPILAAALIPTAYRFVGYGIALRRRPRLFVAARFVFRALPILVFLILTRTEDGTIDLIMSLTTLLCIMIGLRAARADLARFVPAINTGLYNVLLL